MTHDNSVAAQHVEDDFSSVIDARVVFLTHYIPLYQVRVLQSIARRVRDFHVLLSTPIEPNRDFAPDWSGLDVTVQDTWTVRHRWKHRGNQPSTGFDDPLYVHIPYDTSRRLRQLKPDVVMSLELGARSAGVVRYCRKHPETKSLLCTYMSEHTEQGRGWARKQLRKKLVKHADAMTYNGPSCKRYLQSFGVGDDRLHHFPYAADDRTVYTGPLERDEQQLEDRFLCVGQLSERKGVVVMTQQLVDYCQRNPNRNVHVTFAGDGPLRFQLESMPTPPNLTLKFLGNVTPKDLAVAMLSSSVLIAPTLADEWMLVVNEALQAGMPVVGSIYAQAVTTLVDDGANGWQYDPADPKDLGRSMELYFSKSREEIAGMRNRARQSVEQRTPDWAAAGAVDAIRTLMGIKDGQDYSNVDQSETARPQRVAK